MATFYVESPDPPKPDYSYTRPPNCKVGAILWRYKIWFEGTFVLSVLEYWEKLVVISVFAALFILFLIGTFNYVPYLLVICRRGAYYAWGGEHSLEMGLNSTNGYGGTMGKEL